MQGRINPREGRREGKRNDGKETAYLFMFDVKNEKNIIRVSNIPIHCPKALWKRANTSVW